MTSIPKNMVLYDIPSRVAGQCWSPNVWRVRLVLHYKKIPYDTIWVEYPDIEAVGKSIGAAPTSPRSNKLLYTCPMLTDPIHLDESGKPTVLSDSSTIVNHLERFYPDLPVFLPGSRALQHAWYRFADLNFFNEVADLVISKCPDALNGTSKEYFVRTRTAWYPPEVMNPDREANWKLVKAGLNKIADAFDKNASGEHPLNLEVVPGRFTYADTAVLAPLIWADAILDNEEMSMLRGWNGGRWGALLEKYASLIEVSGYRPRKN